ncbi:MAG: SPOR domain-containing protein [Ekhidna sp.]|uniref:SPOR domain-containing protein n=1 Tax=Ekhidna sp. TaxID=2608089 RepID=UPI0032EB6B92
MRTYRLAILILLGACKASTPTSTTSSYSEDLSIHRPVIVAEEKVDEDSKDEVKTEAYTPLSGHIRQELDSIGRVAYEENRAGKYVEGYVIQVYSGSSRDDANNARYKMNELFPELDPKVSYHQPTFRVKAGRFTDRLKAHRIYEQVKKDFPTALLIPERFLQKYE